MTGASLVIVVPEQLSLNVGTPRFTLPFAVSHLPASVLTVTVGGAVIAGFSSSVTITLNEAVSPVLAVNCTVVVPIGNSEPEAGTAVTVPHPNVEDISKLTSAPHCPVIFDTIIFAGLAILQNWKRLITGRWSDAVTEL